MSVNYASYANSDPSINKLSKEDREGRNYQKPTSFLGAQEFEITKTLVPAVGGGTIPAASIVSGWVEITGAPGAGYAMLLPSMASTPAITDFIQLLVSQGGFYDLKSVSNSTAGGSSTGPVRGFEFLIYNNTAQTLTVSAPADASIVIPQVGSPANTLLTQVAARFRLYAIRSSTGALTYNLLRI